MKCIYVNNYAVTILNKKLSFSRLERIYKSLFYMMSRVALLFIIVLDFKGVISANYTYGNIYGPLYGEEWIFVTDDLGNPHYVNLTYSPQEPDSARILGDVYFDLFTRQNKDEPEALTISDDRVDSSFYNKSNNLKIVTHGWQSRGDTDWIIDIKNNYLENSDVNVIAVDWSSYSILEYFMAAMMTRYVGRRIAEMSNAIGTTYETPGSSMHFVGHSLGAHVMGYAASFSDLNIARVTGLDPANPLFEQPDMGDSRRLDKSDADFVDIIHTCGGLLGYKKSHGHADFYPNGGTAAQPGCGGVQYMLEACSHGSSYIYFSRSILFPNDFTAYPCENWDSYQRGGCSDNSDVMGEHASSGDRGEYYLDTSNKD